MACSRTKDSFTSRLYHQTVSQFNPLFNGEQALLKGEQTLARNNKDDFSKILRVFPIGTEEDAASVKPDMDKAIEKATKVIQKHSMMIRNDQKNDFIDDSYLLIGKARFYNYEHLAALETFNYIIQQFPESKVFTEAVLWAGKTESALGNNFAAKDRFESIYRSEDLPKKLKAQAFASYAQLEIDKGNHMGAYQLLEQAVERSSSKAEKVRWTFIMGQLQVKLGNGYKASQLFEQVVKKGPPYELLFQAQLARARNYDVDLQDPSRVFKDLQAMIRDEKNYDNRDQIYYVMAELAERIGDEARMEEYLKQSVKVSTTNAEQKGLSFFKLAETNFRNSLYPVAAAYYDSAYSNLPSTNENYKEVETKKQSLAGLVENLNIIATQDSLLMLAGMGEKQRLKKIQSIIDKEEEEQERSRQEEQNLLNNPPAGGDNSIAQAGQNAIQGGSWYFYNQNLRSTGVRDFRNRFGNRKLEDDWRRKDKQQAIVFQEEGENPSDSSEVGETGETPAKEGDKLSQYLANVPSGEKAIAEAHRKIMVASMNIGDIYRNDLKDLPASEKQFKDLLIRYPDIEERPRIWYTLYRINVALEDQADAEKYKALIMQSYPDSEYAALVSGKGLKDPEANPVSRQYYRKTYDMWKAGNLKKAVLMADSGITAFTNTAEAPQFLLIKAYCQGQQQKTTEMETTLRSVVSQYPGTDQASQAQTILDHISQEEEVITTSTSTQPKVAYKTDEKEEHKYLAMVPNTRGLVNNVTIDIITFNNTYFKNVNLNAKSVYISPEEQMVLVSGLPNKQKAMQYFNLIQQQKVLEKNLKPNEIKHFVISNSNFTDLYREKDFSGYMEFFNSTYNQKDKS